MKLTEMKLTDKQKQLLERHSTHHSKKHMDLMRKLMREGKTFTESHQMAKKRLVNNYLFIFYFIIYKKLI